MSEEIVKKAMQEYLGNVKWLRTHVAPDDIYEFAQQAVMAAEYFIGKLHESTDLNKAVQEDKMMFHWINNIFSLQQMKDNNFQGIVDVSWRVEK